MANHIEVKSRAKLNYGLSIGLCLVLIVIMASACTPAVQQAAPTATATNAPLPTTTATPDPFAGLNECHAWRDARENCVVSVDDLMSGKLVDYARAVTEPFPENALVLWPQSFYFGSAGENHYYFIPEAQGLDEEGLAWQDEEGFAWLQSLDGDENQYHVANEVFADPRSPVGESLVFLVKGDGTSNLSFDILAEVVKIRNCDKSVSYYTIIQLPAISMGDDNGPSISVDITEEWYDDLENNMPYHPPSINQGRFGDPGYRALLERYGKLILSIADDETTKPLFTQWQTDCKLPIELEKRPLFGGGIILPDFPWS